MAGYSGTPLAKKLGIVEGTVVHVVHEPSHYKTLLDPLPSSVRFLSRLTPAAQVVHLFTAERAELASRLTAWRTALPDTVVIWVSWPKKSAKVATDITEDTVRAVALPLGFVDVKVCAVDEVWSGLKLVVRKELRVAGGP
ncbi:DUF3052 domain-containing protein [Gemmatimonas sp.]|uniref:DUF3052 domain-containing protein n=1 Tax=Gemmatimonas sp. TaxID=1962908 RepID=UPI00286DBCDC|nr:DUF3052 domain-containing protein [Gemmatimonas sp.]